MFFDETIFAAVVESFLAEIDLEVAETSRRVLHLSETRVEEVLAMFVVELRFWREALFEQLREDVPDENNVGVLGGGRGAYHRPGGPQGRCCR